MTELKKFSDLSGADQEEVIRQYYESDKTIKSIISEFGLIHQPGQLVGQFPPVQTQDLCPYCREKLVCARESRSGYSYKSNAAFCESCGHSNQPYCTCSNCRAVAEHQAQTERREKLERIAESFPYQEVDVQLVPKSMENAVGLLAMDRHSIDEHYTRCYPAAEEPIPLAPTFEFSKSIVMGLFQQSLIQVDHNSPSDAFVFGEKRHIERFYPMQCEWLLLPLNAIEDRRHLIDGVFRLLDAGDWPEEGESEIDLLWRRIAIAECEAHFQLLHDERHLAFEMSEPKTIDTIDRGLDHFSPAQMANLCWQSARDAVDYMAKEGLPQKLGQNMSRTILSRKIDRAVTDRWQVKPARRDRRLPRSSFSGVFFDVVTGFGETYFQERPPQRPQ